MIKRKPENKRVLKNKTSYDVIGNATSLLKSEEKFDLIFEASDDLIFILDNRGCFSNVNHNGATALDYVPKDLIGRHFWEFVDPKSDQTIAKSFQEILHSEEFTTFEITMTSKFGKEIIFQITARSLTDNNKVIGMIGVGKNITKAKEDEYKVKELSIKLVEAKRLNSIERKRANQRTSILDELSRMKNEFVSNVSHEMRTPLASIIGFSETLVSDPDMPKDMQNEFLNIILKEGKRLAELINNVLDLNKIEGGGIVLNRSHFDIINLLNRVIYNIKKPIEDKKIILTCDIPVEEVIINGDEEKLEEVFNGLLNNAVKFTEPGGRITISAQTLYKEIEIIVSDTGVGIPEKDLPNIFQKFYRVSRPGTEIPGTGLGLVFAKQIVDLHKGLINIDSEVNSGTSFVVKLPRGLKLQTINKG